MKLKRDTIDGWIGGVCAGLADYFKVDVTFIRVIWAICILCYGFGLIPYLFFWCFTPAK